MNNMTRKKIRTVRNNYARYIGLLKRNVSRCHRTGEVWSAQMYQEALNHSRKELNSFEFFLKSAHAFVGYSCGLTDKEEFL